MKNVKDQLHAENYSLYNGDCIDVIQELPDDSIDFIVYSPPFAGLYIYSSDKRDTPFYYYSIEEYEAQ